MYIGKVRTAAKLKKVKISIPISAFWQIKEKNLLKIIIITAHTAANTLIGKKINKKPLNTHHDK